MQEQNQILYFPFSTHLGISPSLSATAADGSQWSPGCSLYGNGRAWTLCNGDLVQSILTGAPPNTRREGGTEKPFAKSLLPSPGSMLLVMLLIGGFVLLSSGLLLLALLCYKKKWVTPLLPPPPSHSVSLLHLGSELSQCPLQSWVLSPGI